MTVFTLFPPIDLTVLAVALAVVSGTVLLALLALGTTQPVLLHIGLRNLLRRPSQTLLLCAGLILSTVVMTASFGLWESLLNTGVKVASGKQLFNGTAGLQFYWLLPLLSGLLVGMGMLLLALLVTLIAVERRTELGMSRALGLQRTHLTQMLLFEGTGYGLVAVIIGVPLGLLLTLLELEWLSRVPQIGERGVGTVQLSLAVRVDWQGVVIPGCLSLLATLLTVWLTATSISRLPIATAMRDLDASLGQRPSLRHLLHSVRYPPLGHAGQPIKEMASARRARWIGGACALLWGVFARGLLALPMAGMAFALAAATGQRWLLLLAEALGLVGLGLLVGWLLPLAPFPSVTNAATRRLGLSLIGLGWLVAGLQGGSIFLELFQPLPPGYYQSTPASQGLELLLGLLLPILGAVTLVLTNADLPGTLWSLLLRRWRALAPLSRTSLAHPLTFRVRTGMTVTLLSLILFLVLLLMTADLDALGQEQAPAYTGGFQLQVFLHSRTGIGPMTPPEQMQAIQSHRMLAQDFSAVGLLRPLFYAEHAASAAFVDCAGRLVYPSVSVADDGFLSATTLPVLARAQGYTSDEQVWDGVRNHPGDAVLTSAPNLGLPRVDGFVPFMAEIPVKSGTSVSMHQVTIIGILPSRTYFRGLFISQRTAAQMVQPPFTGFNTYLFRLQPGVSLERATRDLKNTLVLSPGSVWQPVPETALVVATDQAATSALLLVLSGYLALGLLFGVLAIGIIASRAVVERRQQIGMLRALGFSPTLVRRSFLLETGFVVTLSVLVSTPLALWQAYQVSLQASRNTFPVPAWPVVFILLLSYLVVFVATLFPARQAARLHPAEALRYE